MPDPFKQWDGQLLFQLFDLKGYGGLGVTQTSGRQRKALQFVHHNKGFQIFDIHKIIAPSRLNYSINMIKIICFSNIYENYIMRKQGCQCEKTAKIWENSKNICRIPCLE